MIHDSTECVDPTKNEKWHQLLVINQWDFSTKPIAFRDGIYYCIKLCVSLGNSRQWKTYPVNELTEKMKIELTDKGYQILTSSTDE